jgi:hypothetical protein
MAALREARKPLIVHNGLLDLLHVYSSFIDNLPQGHDAFGDAWLSEFPLLFDTRHIAEEGRHNVLNHAGGLNLEALHAHLKSFDEASLPVRTERLGTLAVVDRPAHGSSGQDAALTAEVFLMEMELWLRSAAERSSRKRHRKVRIQELEAELQALDWQSVHERARSVGVSITRVLTVEGRFGGTQGARRKLADIRADVVNMEYAREVDEKDSANLVRSSSGKRSYIDAAVGSTLSAEVLLSHKVCRRFHNVLAIVGASPGFLRLGSGPTSSVPTDCSASVV